MGEVASWTHRGAEKKRESAPVEGVEQDAGGDVVVPASGVADGDGVWAAGSGGELRVVVVGAGAGAEAAGDGGDVGVAAGPGTGAAAPEEGGD